MITDLHNWLTSAWIDPFWRGFLISFCLCLAAETIANLIFILLWKPWRRRVFRRKALARPQEPAYAAFDQELDPETEPVTGTVEKLSALMTALDEMAQRIEPTTVTLGEPEVWAYHEAEYEEPLRCSTGTACGGRLLVEHELFWLVPPTDDPSGPFVVVCGDCTVIPEDSPLADEIFGMGSI